MESQIRQRIDEFKNRFAAVVNTAAAGLNKADISYTVGHHLSESDDDTVFLANVLRNTFSEVASGNLKMNREYKETIDLLRNYRRQMFKTGEREFERGDGAAAQTIASGVAAVDTLIQEWSKDDYLVTLVKDMRAARSNEFLARRQADRSRLEAARGSFAEMVQTASNQQLGVKR